MMRLTQPDDTKFGPGTIRANDVRRLAAMASSLASVEDIEIVPGTESTTEQHGSTKGGVPTQTAHGDFETPRPEQLSSLNKPDNKGQRARADSFQGWPNHSSRASVTAHLHVVAMTQQPVSFRLQLRSLTMMVYMMAWRRYRQ